MTVAIIGAGIQGCSAAVELSMRGVDVVLFERAGKPMEGASRWNEGKIHLGYIFANESGATAQALIRGAMVFHRKLTEYLGAAVPESERSEGFIYGVHRESLLAADDIAAHFSRVDALVSDALAAHGADYLGQRGVRRSTPLPPAAFPFDGEFVGHALQTGELAIDPHAVADRLADRVTAEPRITFVGGTTVSSLQRSADGSLRIVDATGFSHGPFRDVINASWESRLGLDRTLGYSPPRPWLHRYKLALHARGVAGASDVRSTTLMLGPFGDVVNLGAGRLYLSWYPVTRIGITTDLVPPDPEEILDAARRAAIAVEVVRMLATVHPALRSVALGPRQVTVRGGHIFAWGESDIGDVRSGLHQRHAVGIISDRGYHSIDTGKYAMAPLHAGIVADRITGDA
ncbi:MAG: FAD-dependent oxidoreductase [Betaproteobacteria bacterium]